jgi:hypothetical protein
MNSKKNNEIESGNGRQDRFIKQDRLDQGKRLNTGIEERMDIKLGSEDGEAEQRTCCGVIWARRWSDGGVPRRRRGRGRGERKCSL